MGSGDDKPTGEGQTGEPITDQPSGVVPLLTPEQMMEILQQQYAVISAEVFGVLKVLAPHLSDDEAAAIAQHVTHEQLDQKQIPMIVRSMINPDDVAKHPTMHLYVHDAKFKIEMKAPKRLENIKDPRAAAQSAVMLAFLLAPGARAVLRAFGFKYNLAQSQTPAGGRVILSS
jgi:hypothetical protein